MVCILKYVPVFAGISSGFRVILVTIAASAFGAWKFPHDPDGKEAGQTRVRKRGRMMNTAEAAGAAGTLDMKYVLTCVL